MAYSQAIAQAIENYFAENNLTYTKDETSDDECIFTFRLKLRCKLQTSQELIFVRDNNFSILATIPISADENHRLAAAEYLTRCNYNLRVGNFELNMTDGDIRYKNYVFIGEGPVSAELVKNSIVLPFLMIEWCADGLLSVLFDFSTPQEAFESLPK